MTGTVFDIKEFSLHDGPGARITVFLKGCPLKCKWCHNPEGLSSRPQLMYKENVCAHCGKCMLPCSHPECRGFNRCIHACPNGALSISGWAISSDELVSIINKNAEILNSVDGGVTFSGGEPMLQADFVCETADKLQNIHKAIQTSGYTDSDTYMRVINSVDFIMQDIKLADENEHIKYTGCSNRQILLNIKHLKQSGKKFVFRIPLIPQITDTKENLEAIAAIAEDYPCELLSYNDFAPAKYAMLDMKYELSVDCRSAVDYTSYFKNAVIK